MKYSEKLKNKGFEMKIRKECEDGEGYDLYLTVSKGDSFLEVFYSMSNSKGYYFTSDSTDCNGDGCDWDIDHEQILCDYFGVEELKEMWPSTNYSTVTDLAKFLGWSILHPLKSAM